MLLNSITQDSARSPSSLSVTGSFSGSNYSDHAFNKHVVSSPCSVPQENPWSSKT